jgi:hypothetical protein
LHVIIEFRLDREVREIVTDIASLGGVIPAGDAPIPMGGSPPTVCVPIEATPDSLESMKGLRGFVQLYGDPNSGPICPTG